MFSPRWAESENMCLPRTKFQSCGFDGFLAARRRVKSGFKAVSRYSKFRESLPQRGV
jgi:hypothetical protein